MSLIEFQVVELHPLQFDNLSRRISDLTVQLTSALVPLNDWERTEELQSERYLNCQVLPNYKNFRLYKVKKWVLHPAVNRRLLIQMYIHGIQIYVVYLLLKIPLSVQARW